MYATMLTLAYIAQVPVGPLDAFRANFSSIKVDTRFVFTRGTASADAVDQLRTWSLGGVTFPEDPQATVTGRWACNGAVEMLNCEYPALAAAPSPGQDVEVKDGIFSRVSPALSMAGFDVLADGAVQVEHRRGEPDIQVHLGEQPGMVLLGRGPFCWWGTFQFPSTLRSRVKITFTI